MKKEGEHTRYLPGKTITFRLSKRRYISNQVMDFLNNKDKKPNFNLNEEILEALELYVRFMRKGSTVDELLSEIEEKKI